MPTGLRTLDVADLASVLLSSYYEGSTLHQVVDEHTSEPEQIDLEVSDSAFVVEIKANGDSLRGLAATLDALQLAVDAATATVFYDREFSNHINEDLDYRILRDLIEQSHLVLEIEWLSNGTFRARFKAIFKSPVTYAVAVAVAVVATAAINIVFPPLIVPSLIVGGSVAVGGVPAAIFAQRAKKKQDAVIDELVAENKQQDTEIEALKSDIQTLSDKVALLLDSPRSIVDKGALKEADIQSIEITSAPPRAA